MPTTADDEGIVYEVDKRQKYESYTQDLIDRQNEDENEEEEVEDEDEEE